MSRTPKGANRRFSTASNAWTDEDGLVPVRPRAAVRSDHGQEKAGRRGRTLVIHARADHPLRSKVVGGATLAELVTRLIDEREDDKPTFRAAFLALHSMFIPSLELLCVLGTLYPQTHAKLQLVNTIKRWVEWHSIDFADMKMRFKLRELFLEFSRVDPSLQSELQATLRLCEQVHVTIRPPSYYMEQSVKCIEAALPKKTPSSRNLDDDRSEAKTNKASRIHDTLKAQNYDPFDSLQQDDGNDPDEPTSPARSPARSRSPRPLARQMTISSPASSPSPRRHWKGSEYLFDLSPTKVCHALTVLDHIQLKSIKIREFVNKQWTRPDAPIKAPNLTTMIDQYNARSYWVASEVLVLRQPAQRIKAMRFFIDLAQECANVKNFFAVFSIIHGLNQSPLFRLQPDWNKLPRASKACLANLKNTITEPSGNSKAYRSIKHEALIPHLAYITKLLVALDELPLYAKGPETRINFDKKILAIYNVLADVQHCQRLELGITQDSALLELVGQLSRSLYDATTSIKLQDMWTLSFIYLPKTSRGAHVIPMYGSEGTPTA